jgi:hypothetical protein
MKTSKLPVTGLRVCSMCNLNVVEDEYHFIQNQKSAWLSL